MSTYFVTGTNTDAGKTLVTSALLYAARRRDYSTLGLKPVASGSDVTESGLRNADALALQAHSAPPVAYSTVNPFAFAPAIAPHLAAAEAGRPLSAAAIIDALRQTLKQTPRDFTLVEGAGGWRVPLNADEDFSELAAGLKLPVILTVGLTLGCLNHARLSAEAIAADGLRLVGWVGSAIDPAFSADTPRFTANLELLERKLGAPCLGIIPHLKAPSAEAASTYLTLQELQ
ncbi:dethiobiotin synthase [Vreelandella subglaciescola]|jgi:dethiobiotin synthetase|uniref:ATP-dependent dethiobiotin synthetase BioD n=1 Tax=Vreelandella subglaciescola TaxID=29571 RepID=A0A1M7G3J3_9GAMM|nr:dethiobiotin synthase [Halomonas subglaciescola]SHM10841.1 dethiobiotin synthetase [Halomonas subglaciescola]